MKMMRKIFSKDFRITVFSIGWWFYVALTVLGLLTVTKYGNTLPDQQSRLKLVLYLSIIELIILRIYKYSLRYTRSSYNYWNELPCYLCNQSTILCIIASITDNRHIMAFCIIIGTLGAILAYVMPDSYNRDQAFYSLQALGFYGYHGLIIITCLSFRTLRLYESDLRDSLWVMLTIFLLAVIAHIINYILRKTGLNKESNYVYTYHTDNIGILNKLYSLIPMKLFYLIPIMPVFGLLAFVILLII